MKKALWNFFIPNKENTYRPYSLRHEAFIVYVVVAVVLKLGVLSIIAVLPRTYFFADVTRSALVVLTNDVRKTQGLAPLSENSLLARAAQDKAQDLVTKGYFAHQSPDGKTPWYWFKKAGYAYTYAGENLAKDFIDSDKIVEAWLASPLHRANILNSNYRDIGIAVASATSTTGQRQTVVVQLFGNPLQQKTSPPPSPAVQQSPAASPATPSISPKTTFAPTSTPMPTPLTAVAVISPSASPEPTEIFPAISGAEPAVVAGAEQSPERMQQDAGTQPAGLVFALRFMTHSERAIESFFMLFLAFVLLISLLNFFVHIDIQHRDLLARSLALTVFFLVLAAFSGSSLLHYVPQIL